MSNSGSWKLVGRHDPSALPPESAIRVRHVRDAAERLDGTYVIRLFAEFETGLRTYWLATRTDDPPSRTRHLIDSIAARQAIADEQRIKVHEAREYRNKLIHHQSDLAATLSIDHVRSRLCSFFARLPIDW
jgi:hypothetical protein